MLSRIPPSPQVFCLYLFLFAASLFGTIVAQVNEIVAQLTTKKKDLDYILEAYLVIHPRWVLLPKLLHPDSVRHSTFENGTASGIQDEKTSEAEREYINMLMYRSKLCISSKGRAVWYVAVPRSAAALAALSTVSFHLNSVMASKI
jgi:hypothetical protein